VHSANIDNKGGSECGLKLVCCESHLQHDPQSVFRGRSRDCNGGATRLCKEHLQMSRHNMGRRSVKVRQFVSLKIDARYTMCLLGISYFTRSCAWPQRTMYDHLDSLAENAKVDARKPSKAYDNTMRRLVTIHFCVNLN
jgi:hypothetical protein